MHKSVHMELLEYKRTFLLTQLSDTGNWSKKFINPEVPLSYVLYKLKCEMGELELDSS